MWSSLIDVKMNEVWVYDGLRMMEYREEEDEKRNSRQDRTSDGHGSVIRLLAAMGGRLGVRAAHSSQSQVWRSSSIRQARVIKCSRHCPELTVNTNRLGSLTTTR